MCQILGGAVLTDQAVMCQILGGAVLTAQAVMCQILGGGVLTNLEPLASPRNGHLPAPYQCLDSGGV